MKIILFILGCNCKMEGSKSSICDKSTGQCDCKTDLIDGLVCEKCKDGYFKWPNCEGMSFFKVFFLNQWYLNCSSTSRSRYENHSPVAYLMTPLHTTHLYPKIFQKNPTNPKHLLWSFLFLLDEIYEKMFRQRPGNRCVDGCVYGEF